ncbi:LysR family transcriptional regulator [Pusillimonas noertemannii]|uniref:LysR family transcriptional regulator n=1 Tax=Pusillimonas noertemannii TaxID=305977 RepID=UPI0004744E0A|nr:LysR family transcriptional regulator [Pusillimonas noertemannii]
MSAKLDLNLLRLIVQLHASRNVSRAAEALQLSQPATSLALGRLRRLIGDPLFVRGAGGMLPTPRCDEVVAAARDALALVDAAIYAPTEFNPETAQREFQVTLSDIGETVFLPKLMAHISRLAPQCNLRSRALTVEELPEAMESGSTELAIGFFPDLERTGFYMQRLFEHNFVCLVRKDHPRVKGDRVSLPVFLDLPHAVVEPEGRSHELFEQLLKKKGLSRRVQLNIPHFMSVPAIIAATDMIVTVPHAVAEYFLRLEGLRMVKLPIKAESYSLKQHWHARLNADPALKWLRGQVAHIFSVDPYK